MPRGGGREWRLRGGQVAVAEGLATRDGTREAVGAWGMRGGGLGAEGAGVPLYYLLILITYLLLGWRATHPPAKMCPKPQRKRSSGSGGMTDMVFASSCCRSNGVAAPSGS